MATTRTTTLMDEPVATIRVGVVEDHTFMREGMKIFVESLDGFECAWQASSASEAISQLSIEAPAVLIVDITLPDRNGIELIKDIHATHPEIAVLVVSMHDEELYAERALKAGAKGYVMKNAPHEAFESSLRRVAEGGIAVSQKMSDRVLMAYSAGARPRPQSGLHTLSDREFEVFQLLGEGRSSHRIAEDLRISSKTVDVHRMNLKNKLGLEDGAAVTRYAIQWVESRKHGLAMGETRGQSE